MLDMPIKARYDMSMKNTRGNATEGTTMKKQIRPNGFEVLARRKARAAHEARMAELLATARAIVDTGVCPCCGTALIRNNALAGWWQCGAYATASHRQPQFLGLPSCSFQTFTER
jgi:hypothetical protein